jgi:hypothetical protein
MCDITDDEEPTYEVDDFGTYRPLADTQQALYALSDYLDQLVQLELRPDLQAKIRAEVIALCNALKHLIVKPDGSLRRHRPQSRGEPSARPRRGGHDRHRGTQHEGGSDHRCQNIH